MSPHETTDDKTNMHPNLARGLAVEKLLARLPSYGDVTIRTSAETGMSTLQASLSSRSDELKATRHFEQSYLVGSKLDLAHTSHLTPLAKDISVSSVSPSGHLTVNFRAVGEGKDEKRVIEVMHAESGVVSELSVSKQHAGFLSGETWGNPAWHPTLDMLVYVAEQHPPSWDAASKPFSAFKYYPNAGEKLYEAHKPALFLLDLRDLHKAKVDQITEITSDSDPVYTQPVFAPTSDGEDLVVFATGRSLLKSGRRLGVIWCYNRLTAIYRLTAALKDTGRARAQLISEKGRSARSPRVLSEDAKTYLFYLSNRSEYEHNSCGSLHRLDLSAGGSAHASHGDILVDTVWAPVTLDAFPGLFVSELPDRPFLMVESDEGKQVTYVTMSTTWRSQERLITVRVHDGKLESHAEAPLEDVNTFNTDGRTRLVAVASRITALPQLRIAEARLVGDTIQFNWRMVKEWTPTAARGIMDEIPRLHSSVIRLPDDPATEILFLSPLTAPAEPISDTTIASAHQSTIFGAGKEVSSIPPLLFDLHGGPNSANTTGFSRSAFSYAAAGFSVAFVNYPGSTGFGQERIEMLSKDCGNLDVVAIRNARDHLVKLGLATTDKGKQHYDGGSHSGFIGAHLSARWPDMFDSVCLRNPVIDLPSCFATSDIPDWSVAQFGVRYDFANPPSFAPTGDDHARLVKCSPSSHLVKRLAGSKEPCMPPTLLQLGSADLRVPPNQGLAWYHALKAHGEPVALLWWPGHGHGLQNEADQPKPFEAVLSFVVERAVF